MVELEADFSSTVRYGTILAYLTPPPKNCMSGTR